MSIALAREGKYLVAKTVECLSVVDAQAFRLIKQYRLREKGSMHGLAVSPDGGSVYYTGAKYNLYSARIDEKGGLEMAAPIDLSGSRKLVNPLGIAISPDGKLAVVALSVANQAAVVDLSARKVFGADRCGNMSLWRGFRARRLDGTREQLRRQPPDERRQDRELGRLSGGSGRPRHCPSRHGLA